MSVDLDTPAPAPAPAAATLPWLRVLYWSVRRELWEHRAIYLAPLGGAVVALAGFLLSTLGLPHAVRAGPSAAHEMSLVAVPYAFAAFTTVMTGLGVGALYCLGALHGERRDRSVLFWKSLPVSDATTVLAKAVMPFVLLPAVVIVVVIATHLIMLAAGTLVVLAAGIDPHLLWSRTRVLTLDGMLLQGVPALTLWYAPLYGWLMLVSAWARRLPPLWALAPPLALALIEKLALGTTVVWSWLELRMIGPFRDMFDARQKAQAAAAGHAHVIGVRPVAHDQLAWDSPQLWIGVALAVIFIAAAARLRRSRDPI